MANLHPSRVNIYQNQQLLKQYVYNSNVSVTCYQKLFAVLIETEKKLNNTVFKLWFMEVLRITTMEVALISIEFSAEFRQVENSPKKVTDTQLNGGLSAAGQ